MTSESCYQRKFKMLFNIPPERITPTNPYADGFTKLELDMRRKAEILKHSKNAIQNKLKKSEKISQIAKSFSPKNMNRAKTCNIPQLSTKSDVPGQSIILYLDDTIPLYNYKTSREQEYSELNTISEEQWNFFPERLEHIETNKKTKIGTIGITESINNPYTVFQFLLPYTSTSPIMDVELKIEYNYQTISVNYTKNINEKNIVFNNVELYTVENYYYEIYVLIETTDGSLITVNSSDITFTT